MQPGSTATFVFRGTSVKFRSTRAWLQSVEQLSLDGRTVMVDMSWPDASVSGDTVVVWQATGLSMSQHTVVITKVSPADKWMVVWCVYLQTYADRHTKALSDPTGISCRVLGRHQI